LVFSFRLEADKIFARRSGVRIEGGANQSKRAMRCTHVSRWSRESWDLDKWSDIWHSLDDAFMLGRTLGLRKTDLLQGMTPFLNLFRSYSLDMMGEAESYETRPQTRINKKEGWKYLRRCQSQLNQSEFWFMTLLTKSVGKCESTKVEYPLQNSGYHNLFPMWSDLSINQNSLWTRIER
jgi:hypothetical protein